MSNVLTCKEAESEIHQICFDEMEEDERQTYLGVKERLEVLLQGAECISGTIYEWLQDFEERLAIVEYDGKYSKEETEAIYGYKNQLDTFNLSNKIKESIEHLLEDLHNMKNIGIIE